LNSREWKVVSYINPKNTIKQIAHATHMNEVEIRRIVFALLQAGLVELIRPAGLLKNDPRSIPPGLNQKNKEQQKSLIRRLIQRIRAL
jgi:hypothetical protein